MGCFVKRVPKFCPGHIRVHSCTNTYVWWYVQDGSISRLSTFAYHVLVAAHILLGQISLFNAKKVHRSRDRRIFRAVQLIMSYLAENAQYTLLV